MSVQKWHILRAFRRAGLCAAFLAAACGAPGASPSPLPKVILKLGATKFVAFGDSITAGETGIDGTGDATPANAACVQVAATASATSAFAVGPAGARPLAIDLAHAYPTDLQALLNQEFPGQGITVANEGSPGESVQVGAARLPCVIGADHPNALIILEGVINLHQQADHPETVIPSVVQTLSADIQAARNAGVSFVFVSTLLPEIACTGNPCRSVLTNAAIVQANASIAGMVPAQHGVLVDAYGALARADASFKTMIGPDGLHLTAAGAQVIAAAIRDAIVATIPKT